MEVGGETPVHSYSLHPKCAPRYLGVVRSQERKLHCMGTRIHAVASRSLHCEGQKVGGYLLV